MNFFKRGNSVDSKREISMETQINLLRKTVETQSKLIADLTARHNRVDQSHNKKIVSSGHVKPSTSKQAMEDGEVSSSSDSTVVPGSYEKDSGLKRWNNYNKRLSELNKGEMSFELDDKIDYYAPISTGLLNEDESDDDLGRHTMSQKREDQTDYEDNRTDDEEGLSNRASSPKSQPINYNYKVIKSGNRQDNNKEIPSRTDSSEDTMWINGKLFKSVPSTVRVKYKNYSPNMNRQDSRENERIKKRDPGSNKQTKRNQSNNNATNIRSNKIDTNFDQYSPPRTIVNNHHYRLNQPIPDRSNVHGQIKDEVYNRITSGRANEKTLTFFRGKPSDNLDEWFFTMERFFKKVEFQQMNK